MPTLDGATRLVHATCIALDGRAALLTGPPGAGKSDLALRCMMGVHRLGERLLQTSLIADDQVLLERRGATIAARCPEAIKGKLEVRGLGVVELACDSEASVHLIVELVGHRHIQRLPDPKEASTELLGVAVPVLRVAPFQGSAPVKVLLALAAGDR